jgi:hypothetical protein
MRNGAIRVTRVTAWAACRLRELGRKLKRLPTRRLLIRIRRVRPTIGWSGCRQIRIQTGFPASVRITGDRSFSLVTGKGGKSVGHSAKAVGLATNANCGSQRDARARQLVAASLARPCGGAPLAWVRAPESPAGTSCSGHARRRFCHPSPAAGIQDHRRQPRRMAFPAPG